ncbi:MAG: helicase-related protein [Clostridia bacterium]
MKIKNIKKIQYKDEVFNLRIKTDKETNHNYFANGLCVSNCHHSTASSLRSILSKCYRSSYKIGFSGTLPKDGTCESFTIQSYIGPCVHKLTSAELISNKKATPVHVECYDLNYLSDNIKQKLFEIRNNKIDGEGTKILNLERNVMRENRDRLLFICEKIINAKNNSLVLFNDVQGKYGRKIYQHVKENSELVVYYIDGSTSSENRDYFKQQMEQNNNVVIVASVGTFSEGISINNLHNIFLAECGKSEVITAQILGRGMRLLEGKEKVIVYDFVDNYIFGKLKNSINYLYKHGLERQRMYMERKFPYSVTKVEFSNSNKPNALI